MIESSKVVLTFESVDEILKCDHSNESHWAVLSCGTIYYVVQGGSNFWVCGWNPKVWSFKWSCLAVLSCGTVYYVVQGGSYLWVCGWSPLESVTIQMKATEQYLSCGTVYYVVQGGSYFWVCGWNPKVWSFKWKLLYSGPFLRYCLLCCTRLF